MVWYDYLFSVLLGIFTVEFVGYFWHRWVEHKEILGKQIAFRHYKHHEVQYPVNKLRNGPGYESADSWTWQVVGGLTTLTSFLVAPWPLALTFSLTGWLYAWGIVANMHSLFHIRKHALWRFKWFQKLVKLHDIHHYDNCNYGICFFFMDRLFGTYRETFPRDENGNRIKMNVFQSYPYRRGADGSLIKS